jgi:C4-dicarboxylate-specific signal transduction histidine kinase
VSSFGWPTAEAEARALACPEALAELLRAFAAEEGTSALRHDIRNKLTTVRNGAFFVRQKLKGQPVLTAEPRLERFLQLIDDELEALGSKLASRLVPPEQVQPWSADLKEVRAAVLETVRWPAGTETWAPEAPDTPVKGNPGELGLALFCLLENAAEAIRASPRKAIRIDLKCEEGVPRLDVADSGPGFVDVEGALRPFHSTKAGRSGLGLKIAARIAGRWGGRMELGRSELGGARATLLLQPL